MLPYYIKSAASSTLIYNRKATGEEAAKFNTKLYRDSRPRVNGEVSKGASLTVIIIRDYKEPSATQKYRVQKIIKSLKVAGPDGK